MIHTIADKLHIGSLATSLFNCEFILPIVLLRAFVFTVRAVKLTH